MKPQQQDQERGYKICDHCNDKVHILQAGTDCNSWVKCGKCESWVVTREEYFNG